MGKLPHTLFRLVSNEIPSVIQKFLDLTTGTGTVASEHQKIHTPYVERARCSRVVNHRRVFVCVCRQRAVHTCEENSMYA